MYKQLWRVSSVDPSIFFSKECELARCFVVESARELCSSRLEKSLESQIHLEIFFHNNFKFQYLKFQFQIKSGGASLIQSLRYETMNH